ALGRPVRPGHRIARALHSNRPDTAEPAVEDPPRGPGGGDRGARLRPWRHGSILNSSGTDRTVPIESVPPAIRGSSDQGTLDRVEDLVEERHVAARLLRRRDRPRPRPHALGEVEELLLERLFHRGGDAFLDWLPRFHGLDDDPGRHVPEERRWERE